ARQRGRLADRAGPPGQDEKGGLERVLGGVRIAQDAAAHAQNHRSVPLHDCREGGFVALVQEPLQQDAVGVPAFVVNALLAQKSEQVLEQCRGHVRLLRVTVVYPHSAGGSRFVPRIFGGGEKRCTNECQGPSGVMTARLTVSYAVRRRCSTSFFNVFLFSV